MIVLVGKTEESSFWRFLLLLYKLKMMRGEVIYKRHRGFINCEQLL